MIFSNPYIKILFKDTLASHKLDQQIILYLFTL